MPADQPGPLGAPPADSERCSMLRFSAAPSSFCVTVGTAPACSLLDLVPSRTLMAGPGRRHQCCESEVSPGRRFKFTTLVLPSRACCPTVSGVE